MKKKAKRFLFWLICSITCPLVKAMLWIDDGYRGKAILRIDVTVETPSERVGWEELASLLFREPEVCEPTVFDLVRDVLADVEMPKSRKED